MIARTFATFAARLGMLCFLSASLAAFAQTATIHYHRPGGDYAGWGLHLWGNGLASGEATTWTGARYMEGSDSFGRTATISISDASQALNFIVHRGDTKDTDNDRSFIPANHSEIWLIQGDDTVYTSNPYANGFARIHYYRPDGNYSSWGLHLWGSAIDPSEATSWASPKSFNGSDGFGAVTSIALSDASQAVWFIIHQGNTKDTPNDRSFIPANASDIWLIQGDSTVYTSNPNGPANGHVRIHYRRSDGNYSGWGLHLWGNAIDPSEATSWPNTKAFSGTDGYGVYADVAITDPNSAVDLLVHNNGSQDVGATSFVPAIDGYETWLAQGATATFDSESAGAEATLKVIEAGARWAATDTIGWILSSASSYSYTLYTHPEGEVFVDGNTVLTGPGGGTYSLGYGGDFSTMDPASAFYARFAYLRNHGFSRLTVPSMSATELEDALKGQLVVVARSGGSIVATTAVQRAGALDENYAYSGDDLGITWSGSTPTLKLWAPSARNVRLHLYPDSSSAASQIISMTRGANGVWSTTGNASWDGDYYLYEVETFSRRAGGVVTNMATDPYAVSLSTNSGRCHIVDLDDAALKPSGWDSHTIQSVYSVDAPEDMSIYELHVRDFSVLDNSVTEAYRGTFMAFTESNGSGMQHLSDLAAAGLTHVHLLPINDMRTVNEDTATRVDLTDDISDLYAGDPRAGQTILQVLDGMAAGSEDQQDIMVDLRGLDGFNWGYDPFHFMAPEGSYSTNPDDATRILECREMVQALHETGLRVIVDVVFNHTFDTAALDLIVPDYYYRLNHQGNVEQSSCCPDTASENEMMEKLVADALVKWVKHYKVDSIRFDLMGHLTKDTIARVRSQLDALTIANDGVDGSKVYLYGEGWDFGSLRWLLPDSSAYQLGIVGTGVGTFNDRIRDSVKGKGQNPAELFVDDAFITDKTTNRDQVLGGMRGTLWDWWGYVTDPQEAINYVTAHDKGTLWDQLLAKVGHFASLDQLTRMQNLGNGIIALSQGVPFFHAGTEILRSKSGDENSYDSGDWFNRLDYTLTSNNWNKGLPPGWQHENHDAWPQWSTRLGTIPQAGSTQINTALAHFKEMLTIRQSSPLFRLRTMADVQARVSFPGNIWNPNTGNFDGRLAVMKLDDTSGIDLDPANEIVWVLVNTSWSEWINFYDDDVKQAGFQLHPVLQNTNNSYLDADLTACCGTNRTTAFTDHSSGGGTISVPPQTLLVYTVPQFSTLTALAENYGTNWDSALEVSAPGVLANDFNPGGGTMEAHLLSGPDHGQIRLNPDGSFRYRPEPGISGPAEFSYKCWDGSTYVTATAVIHVAEGNHAPRTADDAWTVQAGTRLTVAAPGVLGNDSDLETDPLKAYLVSGPAQGKLGLHQDGSLFYDAPADFSGTVTFTYKAGDGLYKTAATGTITVQP